MVNSHAPKTCAAPGSAKDEKKFSRRTGMFEKLGRRRERRKIMALLERVIRNGNGNGTKHFEEALSLFACLEPEQKEKTMLAVEKRLRKVACDSWRTNIVICPFDTPAKAHTIHVAANFFAGAAKYLPKDKDGYILFKPYEGIARKLVGIADYSDPEKSQEKYPTVLRACLRALWELEFGDVTFWEKQISRSPVQDFAITTMLEHEQTETFEEHGWWMLRKRMGDIVVAVGKNDSPKKTDFLRQMLKDEELEVMGNALKASAYLETIPKDFIEAAQEACKKHTYIPLEKLDSLIGMLQDKDFEIVCQGLEVAGSLKIVPEAFAKEAREIGDRSENEEEQEDDGEDDKEKRVAELVQEAETLLDAAWEASELYKAAHDLLQITKLKEPLKESGDPCTHAVGGLIQLYLSGAAHLKQMLEDSYPQMARLAIAGEPHERQNAVQVIAYLDKAGVEVAGTNASPLRSAIDYLIENHKINGETGWSILKGHLDEIGLIIVKNKSPNSEVFMEAMIRDKDPETVRRAFEAAAYYDYVPDEIMGIAIDRASGETVDEEDGNVARKFLEVYELRGRIRRDDGKAAAVEQVLEMYKSGDDYLLPLLQDALSDELKNPRDLGVISNILKEFAMGENLVIARDAFVTASQLPFLQDEFAQLAYEILHDDEKQPLWVDVHGFLDKIYINLAKSYAPEKIDIIREMIASGDPILVRHGFVAAIYLEAAIAGPDAEKQSTLESFHSEEEMKDFVEELVEETGAEELGKAQAEVVKARKESIEIAHGMISDGKDEELMDLADDFVSIMRLKHEADRQEPEMFVPAATELAKLYAQERFYLHPLLYEIATDMLNAINQPWGDTEEEKVKLKQSAYHVLKQMSEVGIINLLQATPSTEAGEPQSEEAEG